MVASGSTRSRPVAMGPSHASLAVTAVLDARQRGPDPPHPFGQAIHFQAIRLRCCDGLGLVKQLAGVLADGARPGAPEIVVATAHAPHQLVELSLQHTTNDCFSGHAFPTVVGQRCLPHHTVSGARCSPVTSRTRHAESGGVSAQRYAARTGIVNVNVEPAPTWLLTEIRPP